MTRYTNTHIVGDNNVYGTKIYIGTQQWYDWLKTVKSFQYEHKGRIISVKRNRQYWHACKQVNGDYRQKHIGSSKCLTEYELKAMVELLTDSKLWQRYKNEGNTQSYKKIAKAIHQNQLDKLKRDKERLRERVNQLEATVKQLQTSQYNCNGLN